MRNKKLSVIIPAYNEARTICLILERIVQVSLVNQMTKEIIVVDDGSSDNTSKLVKGFVKNNPEEDIKLVLHKVNKGKGAAVQSGIKIASGDYLIIQDADLEYHPRDYNKMLEPVFDAGAHVVYGSRFKGESPHRILFFMHTLGNKFLTLFSNIFTNLGLSDVHTCYKLFETPLIKAIPLEENGFAFCPEITAKIARIPNVKIYEVGISYYARTYEEGKKIRWRDGIRAFYITLKYNLFLRRKYLKSGIPKTSNLENISASEESLKKVSSLNT